MKVSATESLILEQLDTAAEHEWLFGMQMVRESNGALKRGSIYVLLGRLEARCLVQSWAKDPEDSHLPPKRYYKITDHGRRLYRAWKAGQAAMAAAMEQAHA